MKFISIEGMDGCGKQTQTDLLYKYLLSLNKYKITNLSFPVYTSDSGKIIKKHLYGEINTEKFSSPYSISLLYSMDRYLNYIENKENINNSDIVLCNRYTMSNIIYQLPKLPITEHEYYIKWLYDIEFDKIGLPIPDLVLYLSVSNEISQELLSKRYNNDSSKKDIYERNIPYLLKCKQCVENKIKDGILDWKVINCDNNGKIRDTDDISKDIVKEVLKIL